ncbi:MAG: hypothetical protein A2W18_14435 [Candidatus Muproteobacteria bacterium RBG_16_60_9]|uniref:Uncharacterized protein n=1 Tax=Candidatus Muproteobacteria bacterium RBG_16_60_9 TaxID=1817755 RepID=A0A1F6VGH5_9PROT|nr:MAG: hypothetical protein A2W18_14435 [Candidatus Muproteobacteria bacterium RBG_16_60_9]
MNRHAAFSFLVAVVASALIWALSPLLAGHAEPWDADGPYYIGALLVAGLIAGVVAPKSPWAHYLGSVVGQLGYELLFLDIGPLILLGGVFLLGFSLIFFVAAVAAAYTRNKVWPGKTKPEARR